MKRLCICLLGLTAILAACAPAAEKPAVTETKAPEPVAIPNAMQPLDGILTGGQPTPEQMDEVARAGYRTVVNLRGEEEPGFEWEKDRVAELGMHYVHIPVEGGAGLTHENVRRLAEVLEDPGTRPAVIHCKSGNRVGALLALHAAWDEGASTEEALDLGRRAGLTSAEGLVKDLLESDGSD